MVATRKLEIQIVGDATSASRMFGNVADQADHTESKMSKWGKAIAGFVGAAFATEVIFDWGKTLINAAEEAQQVTRQTEAVLTSMGDAAGLMAKDIEDLAEKISLKTGLDDEMIQSGENVLLTFGNIHDEVGEGNKIFTRATEVATDMSVALGQDLQSSVTQIGKALNDPIAGISALTRVGVQFTEEQKNMIAWLQASGDTMGAQKIILAELERQFGGSAEAQATASGKLKVAWDNVVEQVGTALLPAFEKISTWLAETLPGAIDTAGQWLSTFKTWVEENTQKAIGLSIAIGGVVIALLLIFAPIYGAIALLTLLAFFLYYAYTNWGWFKTGADLAWGAIQGVIRILGDMISVIKTAIEWVNTLSDTLNNLLLIAGPATAPLRGLGLGAGGGSGLGSEWGQSKTTGRNVPKFADGGIVPGPIGTPRLALVHGGEEVLTPEQRGGAGSPTIIINTAGVIDGRALIDIVNEGLRKGYRLQDRGRGL